jgi:hypothetical protein
MSVDGVWNVTLQSPAGPQQMTFELEEANGALSGTMKNATAPDVSQLSEGTVDGDDLAFKIELAQPMPVTLDFTAKVSGDAIAGNARFGGYGEGAFEGTRA